MCARDHQKVSPTGSSPCRQSCSSLFHARSACYPVTLQHPSSGFALNHSLHKQTQNGKYCGRLTTFTVHVCNAFITKSSQFIFRHSHTLVLSRTCAVHAADAVRMLQTVLVQVSVQTEARLPVASDPLQLGQVHRITRRGPLSVARGDGIDGGHALGGWSVVGGGL